MKPSWWILAGLLASGAALTARDPSQDQANIARAESAVADAWEAGDGDALDNRLADDFTLTDAQGIVTDRRHAVDAVAHRDPAYLMYKRHDLQVRLYGDAAVATGVLSLQGHTANATFAGDYAFTDTWVRADGRWKLAASHMSLLRTR